MTATAFYRIALFALALTLGVVVLGAYVRLSDAGLGCPDWPGCYGHLDVPDEAHQIAKANEAYPQRPVHAAKAWKEMIHRYFAGTLGTLILALAIIAWVRRREPEQPVLLPFVLLGLVIFQALLGMWTVTLLLKPVIVMGHLLGGLTTLALLGWLVLRGGLLPGSGEYAQLRPWALLGLALVVIQIALGGWTSSNYAALACPDFPTCQTAWWPPMDFKEAFTLWRGVGISYEGGVLGNAARVTIHVMHRIGALLVFLYISALAAKVIISARDKTLRATGIVIDALLWIQVSLGIANVIFGLPLWVAVTHTGVAALLLLALVTLNHELYPKRAP